MAGNDDLDLCLDIVAMPESKKVVRKPLLMASKGIFEVGLYESSSKRKKDIFSRVEKM